MQYLAVLGRQPKISLAELEGQFSNVRMISRELALFEAEMEPNLARLGGTIKLARELAPGFKGRPGDFLTDYARRTEFAGKFVVGVSDYSVGRSEARKVQGEALRIKKALKRAGFSVRVLANKAAVLSSATVFHNQLGEKAGHFEMIKFKNRWFVGIGVQNIDAYTARDQARPARDAKVGMLPPKLAQILINLCGPLTEGARILDPFCGTGVVLQEAALMGYRVYGTDLSERMVEMARRNLEWLVSTFGENALSAAPSHGASPFRVEAGDAAEMQWEQPIDAVVFEGYLGPPMSTAPAEIKLKSVTMELVPLYRKVLKNLAEQLRPGTPVVMAVPAWLRTDGHYQRSFRQESLDEIAELGYNVMKYNNLSQEDLLYFRDGQVVAREIIVLRKK